MKRRNGLLSLRAAAAGLAVLTGLAAPALSGHRGALASGRLPPTRLASAAIECEGEACAQVTVTFDETKQQYKAQNNSSDRWVRVVASNLAASATACAAPGKAEYLALKSIEGAYRASYAEPGCDMHVGGR
jgi:hypothetical protein